MAGDKYNVDDILKEVGKRRSKDDDDTDDIVVAPKTGRSKPRSGVGSVTEILNDTGLRRAGVQKKKEPPKTAKQSPRLSVTQILNSDKKNKDLKKGSSARQMTDEESEQRLARDIARAADERRRRMYEIEDEDSSETETDDYIKLFVSQQKPESSDSDDDIVFHDADDFVTTDTMQLRKQKKIDDINEALLRIDSEADSPDDMLDSINAMESREKAVEIVKSGESTNEYELPNRSTDTFTVTKDALKRMSRRDEGVREYNPIGFEPDADDKTDDTPFEGIRSAAVSAEIHLGDTILEALNKKIAEEDNEPREEAAPLVKEEPPVEDEENEEVEKVRQVDELARKKKLKIKNFILDTHDTEELPPAEEKTNEYIENDEDEPIDLDDEDVIKDRLDRAQKGLFGRLLILAGLLAVTLFVAIVNAFGVSGNLGILTKIVSREAFTDNYIYTHLVIGILSFSACSSVVSNGFTRLIKLRPDGDTLCALAHITALIAAVSYIFGNYYVVVGHCEVYLAVSLAALVCNTLSKLFTVNTAKKNFEFVFGGRTKYFIDRCDRENEMQLAKGMIPGVPNIGAMRKTEVLYDFIVSTYCEDASDRMSRKIVPGVIGAGLVGGLLTFLTHTTTDAGTAVPTADRLCWALTVLSAIFALGASFSSSMTVTLPMFLAARKNKERGSAILGYNAVSGLSELNGILVEARTLFPAESVRITNICGYEKPKTSGEGKVSIDDAIIYATSLAVASDSVMADSFFNMLNRKRDLLKDVSGCVYESNLGVMGWIDRQRVLLGNRQHMKSHAITVPKLEKEIAANTDNDEVIYLAVGGQVCLLFFVKLNASSAVKQDVQELCDSGVSLIIKTVDGMITDAEISEQFDVEANKIKILPFEAHETFSECTRFVPRGKAAVSCNGTFTSFANAIRTANTLRSKAFICNIVQLCGVALGVILALILGLFGLFPAFNVLIIMLYNTIFGAAALAAQFLKSK